MVALVITSIVITACGGQTATQGSTQPPAATTAPKAFTSVPSDKVTDSNGAKTTLGALYDAYMASPITNTPADVIKKGHPAVDVGDATPLFDQIWTEVKGGQ
jgi:hypothetical protein